MRLELTMNIKINTTFTAALQLIWMRQTLRIDWYNQRACSENKIKELKCDFGADDLPCSDHQRITCTLAYAFSHTTCLSQSLGANYFA